MEGREEEEKTQGVKFIYRALKEGHMVVEKSLKVTEKHRNGRMMRIIKKMEGEGKKEMQINCKNE